jgi:hypothetical protein
MIKKIVNVVCKLIKTLKIKYFIKPSIFINNIIFAD